MKLAESAYRASVSRLRSLVLPRPSTMNDDDRFAERGRLEMIAQFRKRDQGELYAPIDHPKRLLILKEMPTNDRTEHALKAFADGLLKFKETQHQDWQSDPDRNNADKLISALDRAMSWLTRPDATNTRMPLFSSGDPSDLLLPAEDLLDGFVPITKLAGAWNKRQAEPDMIARNDAIRAEQKSDIARMVAAEAAERKRRAEADARWELGRLEREAQAKAAREASIAAERAAEQRREAQRAADAQKAADAIKATERAAEARKAAEQKPKEKPKPQPKQPPSSSFTP